MARGRPRKALLSRDMIVETALRQIDAGEDLNMSKVARELGVHVSSLYNHVEDRDGLLEEIRLHIAHEYPVPPLAGLSWQDTIRTLATTVHTAYAAHPRLIPVIGGKPITAPKVTEVYDQLAESILRAGFSPRQTAIAIHLIDALALGTILVQSNEPTPNTGPYENRPALLTALSEWSEDQALTRESFERGLANLITGLESELNA